MSNIDTTDYQAFITMLDNAKMAFTTATITYAKKSVIETHTPALIFEFDIDGCLSEITTA